MTPTYTRGAWTTCTDVNSMFVECVRLRQRTRGRKLKMKPGGCSIRMFLVYLKVCPHIEVVNNSLQHWCCHYFNFLAAGQWSGARSCRSPGWAVTPAELEKSFSGKKKNFRGWLMASMASDGYDERDYYVAGTLMSDEAWALITKKHRPVRPVGAGGDFQPAKGFEDLRCAEKQHHRIQGITIRRTTQPSSLL